MKDIMVKDKEMKEYIITYKDGVSSLGAFGIVKSDHDRRSIIEQAQEWCRSKGYRFVSVRDMYIDLNENIIDRITRVS